MSRIRYIGKRVLMAVPVVWFGTTLTWFVIFEGPVDPAAAILGQTNPQNSAEYHAIQQQLGLNQPPLQNYLHFMGHMLTFNLGQSWVVYSGTPVNSLILTFLPRTLWLGFWSVAIAIFVGVPLGFYAGMHSNTKADYLASFGGIVWRSMPNFWLAAMLVQLLGISTLHWGTLGFIHVHAITGNPHLGYMANTPLNFFLKPTRTLEALKKIAPAAVVLGSASMGNEIRIARTAVMEVKNEDFVELAQTKGVSDRMLVWKHVFRNALVPLVPVITTEAYLLIGGSVLVETVFGINGIGRLFVSSAKQGDLPVVGTLMFVFILMLVTINITQDVLYTLIDPRIAYGSDR